ncbi:hypothetical protein HYDPIDRAFT_30621 [Hydnomerulius pinastri MD-312]|uniref:Uncharacterized protein n=1 Tax=Hydnomerulius pinastri MD-312 TaxID=994086 RepID=A0A0C9VVF2_9AGAM|nr:hypothetical protein HYDPIDRAFT_30621 [Hydnomerulius pinastri MD-312]
MSPPILTTSPTPQPAHLPKLPHHTPTDPPVPSPTLTSSLPHPHPNQPTCTVTHTTLSPMPCPRAVTTSHTPQPTNPRCHPHRAVTTSSTPSFVPWRPHRLTPTRTGPPVPDLAPSPPHPHAHPCPHTLITPHLNRPTHTRPRILAPSPPHSNCPPVPTPSSPPPSIDS